MTNEKRFDATAQKAARAWCDAVLFGIRVGSELLPTTIDELLRISMAALDELDRRDADFELWTSQEQELRKRITHLESCCTNDLEAARSLLPDTHSVGSMAVVIGARIRKHEARERELRAEVERLRAELAACEKSRQAMMVLLDEQRSNERLETTIAFGNDLVAALWAKVEQLRVQTGVGPGRRYEIPGPIRDVAKEEDSTHG